MKKRTKREEDAYQQGLDDALKIILKFFSNDWSGGEAIAELKKLKEGRQ